MRLTKNTYLAAFAAIVAVLAVVRLIWPQVAGRDEPTTEQGATAEAFDSQKGEVTSKFFNADGTVARHSILSVSSYKNCFPDSNDVQLRAANRWGVQPVKDRQEAEQRMDELVYVGAGLYHHVDPMARSIPYLVPRAAALLSDIGRAFYDSLQLKGIPLHQPIVTSVLRTKEDIKKLQRYNGNATDNSCHLYGTTFDLSYNRYHTVYNPDEGPRRGVRNDTLKWVLSEVLRDMRLEQRCYVKYEVKQGCFHITVR